MKNITIVDYGSGNVLSAQKSFIKISKDNNIQANVIISKNVNDIKNSTHVVLPGQGAFSTCMSGLQNTPGMIEELYDFALVKKKPFLGICVGMQMLAEASEENGLHKGLGWIKGFIRPLPKKNLKMPHMGWNAVKPKQVIFSKRQTTILDILIFECQDRKIFWQKLSRNKFYFNCWERKYIRRSVSS